MKEIKRYHYLSDEYAFIYALHNFVTGKQPVQSNIFDLSNSIMSDFGCCISTSFISGDRNEYSIAFNHNRFILTLTTINYYNLTNSNIIMLFKEESICILKEKDTKNADNYYSKKFIQSFNEPLTTEELDDKIKQSIVSRKLLRTI